MTAKIPAAVFAHFFVIVYALFGLVACQSLGLEKPETFEQRLAYAYSTHIAILTAGTIGMGNGTLTYDEARHIINLADESRAFLDAARAATITGDIATAEGRLLLAVSILRDVQTYMKEKQP